MKNSSRKAAATKAVSKEACAIAGCNRKKSVKGLCKGHYQQQRVRAGGVKSGPLAGAHGRVLAVGKADSLGVYARVSKAKGRQLLKLARAENLSMYRLASSILEGWHPPA